MLGARGSDVLASTGGRASERGGGGCYLQRAAPVGLSLLPLAFASVSLSPPRALPLPVWPILPSLTPFLSLGGFCQRSPRTDPVSGGRGFGKGLVQPDIREPPLVAPSALHRDRRLFPPCALPHGSHAFRLALFQLQSTVFHQNGGLARRNTADRFTKGWYFGNMYSERILPAARDTVGAAYGTLFNWILSTATPDPSATVQLPVFERKVIFADPARDKWNVGVAPDDIVDTVKAVLREREVCRMTEVCGHTYEALQAGTGMAGSRHSGGPAGKGRCCHKVDGNMSHSYASIAMPCHALAHPFPHGADEDKGGAEPAQGSRRRGDSRRVHAFTICCGLCRHC